MSLNTFYKGKVVLITGGSMGIGKELAKLALKFGARVAITGRTLSKLETVKKEFNVPEQDILIHVGDVTDFSNNQELVKKCIDQFGKIDVLINNAGLSAFGSIEDINPDIYKTIVDTNIYGSVFPTKACIPILKEVNGSVLFVSSIAGFTGLADYSAYSLSKMSLRAIAHSLRIELKNTNVFVGICYVGFTENEESKKTYSPTGELTDIPKRPSFLTSTREQTALKMLKQVKRKRHSFNHSFLGKLVLFQSKIFPNFTAWVMKLNYNSKK